MVNAGQQGSFCTNETCSNFLHEGKQSCHFTPHNSAKISITMGPVKQHRRNSGPFRWRKSRAKSQQLELLKS